MIAALAGVVLALAGCDRTVRFPDPTPRVMERLDPDGSGTITLDEMRVDHSPQVFERIDTDGDGEIDREELAAHLSRFDPNVKEGRGIGGGPQGGEPPDEAFERVGPPGLGFGPESFGAENLPPGPLGRHSGPPGKGAKRGRGKAPPPERDVSPADGLGESPAEPPAEP